MKLLRLRKALLVAGPLALGVALVAPAASADPALVFAGRFFEDKDKKKKDKQADKKKAAKGKKGKDKEEPKDDGPAPIKAKLKLSPTGLKFGMSLKELSDFYSKYFDKVYVPIYKKTQPGPKMDILDAEVKDKKALIKRNHLKFGNTPTGIDYTALKGEYTYGNKESMTHIEIDGVKRYYFFLDDKLWKAYEEQPLGGKSKFGSTFTDAVKLLTKKIKVAPRLREGGQEDGPKLTTADWSDGRTVLQAVDREYESKIGILYVDHDTFVNIDRYRTNKPDDPNKIDKDVAAVTDKSEPVEDKNKDVVKAQKAKKKREAKK